MNKVFKNELMIAVVATLIIFLLICFISLNKFRHGEINFRNSDATFHVLLTIKAYDQTPVNIHKFLPIVTLGSEPKNVSWGATIPDKFGNFYYTSFSPAGYFFPYLFIKVFNLNANETSLYIFNSLLYFISSLLFFHLLFIVFENSKNRIFIASIGTMCLACSPEIFHSMGIVYWHQSLMQVTLLLQIIAYYRWRYENFKSAKFLFFTLCVVNPYVEWSGFVANAGFIIVEIVRAVKTRERERERVAGKIIFLTLLAFTLFVCHYLMVVELDDFFRALKARFFARNIASQIPISSLIAGYVDSYLYIWLFVFILLTWCAIKNAEINFSKKKIFFIVVFIVFENIIMKGHAISYTFDRMKFGFVLSFFVCILLEQLLETKHIKKLVFFTCLICCVLNLISYKKDKNYIWEVDYRKKNEIFANYINKHYLDSLLALDKLSVRGYVNMLFGRNVYENKGLSFLKQIPVKNDYLIELRAERQAWNMYKFNEAVIYDSKNNNTVILNLAKASNFTDKNWTKGIKNENPAVILFNNTSLTQKTLNNVSKIVCNDNEFDIIKMQGNSKWIHLLSDTDISSCAYPSNIIVKK